MLKSLVTLFSAVHVPVTSGAPVNPDHVRFLNAEAGALGYSFDADLMAKLNGVSAEAFSGLRSDLLMVLSEVSGASVSHKALFRRFPYSLPEDSDYLFRRLLAFLQTRLGTPRNDFQILSCGHVIDPLLFDLSDFGACPVCQHQVDEIDNTGEVRHAYQGITPLKVLRSIDQAGIAQRASALLSRNGSLSDSEKAFLGEVKGQGLVSALERPAVVFKETLPFVYDFFNDVDYVSGLISGATDVLRIAVHLSDKNGDLSLKESTWLKLSTRHKKNMLRLLESRGSLVEDMLRHRERWLRFGEIVNPGSAKNRALFPKTAAAFDTLRNAPGQVATFNRVVEGKLRAKCVDRELLETLKTRPGEFLRRLDFLLRHASSHELVNEVLSALGQVVEAVPTKRLFEMRSYLTHRSQQGTERVFFPKGSMTKMQVVEDKRGVISDTVLARAVAVLNNALHARLKGQEPLGKVYVDPALQGIVLPFNQRGASATSKAISKGSRYPFKETPVIRLFVWWKGDVDVDLSVNMYTDSFSMAGNVSWLNMRMPGVNHSGDIVNAPEGASEFIDIDVNEQIRRGIRYVATSLISYRGDGFNGFPCFAGFMERDALRSGAHYEPEATTLKFDLTAGTNSYMPLVFDLWKREVIFADIVAGGGRHATMVGGNNKFAAMARNVLDLVHTKPTAWDVLTQHAKSRGTLVEDPSEADLIYKADDLDMEQVVALTA